MNDGEAELYDADQEGLLVHLQKLMDPASKVCPSCMSNILYHAWPLYTFALIHLLCIRFVVTWTRNSLSEVRWAW